MGAGVTVAHKEKKKREKKLSTLRMNLDGVSSGHLEANSEPPIPTGSSSPKLKISPKLNRWSMGRALRSGGKLDRPTNRSDDTHRRQVTEAKQTEEAGKKTSAIDVEITAGKSIYLVSDGTGWTAEHSVNAALGQFEDFSVNRGSSVNTHLFSWVLDIKSSYFHFSDHKKQSL